MVQENTQEAELVFNQFLLSEMEQINFKKMIAKYNSMDELARGIGLLKDNIMKVFDYTETVDGPGTQREKTIRTPKQHCVRNWKNLMNRSGWTWVNENIFILAGGNNIICPTTIVHHVMQNYNLKFARLPTSSKVPETFRIAMNNLFKTKQCQN